MKVLHIVMLASFLATQASADVIELTVRADQPGDRISRYLYGQFAEHLGRGIYEGVWVGEDSAIPNTRGIRNDVIDALKQLHIPVVRWPGGCFADEYHWRDGIGPRDQRPVRINTHWGWVEEDNAFGTHEFFDFIEQIGSEAYIAGNAGSGPPREMAQWLEYMTADNDTTLARLRRANGRDEPWKVPFFGVGNESWGCGGNMTPAYYADVYNRYATFLKAPSGNQPKLVASGGSGEQTEWTEELAANTRARMDGISHHYYTLPTGNWSAKGRATGFGEEEWLTTLRNTMRIDDYLSHNEAVLDKHDPDGNVGIYLDEWGTWYDAEPGSNAGFLYQQNSIRDAVVAALNFNIFHRHARRLHMANIAQTVNVLQAVVLTDGPKILRTPTYHAFEMYVPFQDATFVPVDLVSSPEIRVQDEALPQISASAAIAESGELILSLVNLHPSEPVKVRADLWGFEIGSIDTRVLAGDSIDAHNTFDNPDAVMPAPLAVVRKSNGVSMLLPAHSVAVMKISAE